MRVQALLPLCPWIEDCDRFWGKCQLEKWWCIVTGMDMLRVGSAEIKIWDGGLPSGVWSDGWSWEVWDGCRAGWRSVCTLLAFVVCFTGWYALLALVMVVSQACEV